MIRKLNVSMNPWKLSDPVYESHRNTFLLSVVDNLKDLTHLNFSGIGLNEIPKVIENFIGLKVVDLSNNEISEIDGAIFNQFRYVSKLDLSKNKISALPKVRYKSVKLYKFITKDNSIVFDLTYFGLG